MTHIYKTAIVPYPLDEMYIMVSDVGSYPHFLPWCKDVVINSRTDLDDEIRLMATIKMGSIGLEKSFTTTNVLRKNKSIDMRLVKGPFSSLQGQWHFQSLGETGCKITLEMDFEISNKLLGKTLGPIFTKIMNSLIDAFIQQANKLHGKPTA